ncbi:MAG: hypothetical protein ACI4WS_01630 [Oscillospiraceae bacterium]
MNTFSFDKIENEVLSFISEKSHSVIDTVYFIQKFGYTMSEAEEILKKIYSQPWKQRGTAGSFDFSVMYRIEILRG